VTWGLAKKNEGFLYEYLSKKKVGGDAEELPLPPIALTARNTLSAI
jgi:hypothetical protein